MQSVGDELGHVVERKRRESDITHHNLRCPNGSQSLHQWMRGADFVVTESSDQQEVMDVGMRDEVLEQLEGRRIQPLEIVEKNGERVLLACEHSQKRSEHHVKTALGFRGGEGSNRGLLADDEHELGNEAHNELAIRANGFLNRLPPTLDRCLALAEDLANEDTQRLSQRGVRNISSVLVEFSGPEYPAWKHDRFVQLMNDRGFADSGVTGHQNQRRCSGGDHSVEGGQQDLALLVTSVEFLGHDESVGSVVRAEGERVDASHRFPLV